LKVDLVALNTGTAGTGMTNDATIRDASMQDAAVVAPLIVQAMGSLVERFLGSNGANQAVNVFQHFFVQTGNQYSYQNALVYEENGVVLGSLVAYDGAKLWEYREPFFAYLREHFGFDEAGLGDETQSGEFYLDTISVAPEAQGKGIGKALLAAGIERGRSLGFRRIGLLVDTANPDARRLYERLGFRSRGLTGFAGGHYEHMGLDT